MQYKLRDWLFSRQRYWGEPFPVAYAADGESDGGPSIPRALPDSDLPVLLPDVDESCEQVAGAITPRVGGVGPTTIAMLFRNAVECAERQAR